MWIGLNLYSDEWEIYRCYQKGKAVGKMEERGMVERQVDERSAWFYVAVPARGYGPGVIVLHAWWGLTDFFKGVCDRLAEAGFVAVAPDLYDGRVAQTVEEAQEIAESMNYIYSKAKVTAAAGLLMDHPGVRGRSLGAIGFSMGAGWALLLSILDPKEVAAVVAFYGTEKADYSRARAAYLGHFVEEDPYEHIADVRIMEDAIRGSKHEITIYLYPGAKHWFFEADRPEAYDPEAAQLAWERTIEFLKAHLPG